MSRNCSACGKDDIGIRAGGLTPSCASRQDVRRLSTFVTTRCTLDSPVYICLSETGRAPIKTGWAETDKGQPGKPNVRARWVAKDYKTQARPELQASTPPLEALKVVLSEIATGKREGKVAALVDVRRGCFHAPARRSRPRTTSRVTNICVDCCDIAFHVCEEATSRGRTSWQPCTATTSQSVGNGRQWSPS